MSTTQTLRPNATVQQDAGWTLMGGAATAHAATNDNNNATGIEFNSANGDACIMDYGTYALAANERCLRARVKILGYADATYTEMRANLRIVSDDATEDNLEDSTLSAHNLFGSWVNDPPGATYSEWTQAAIDAVRTRYRGWTGASGFPYGQVLEGYVELDIHTKPSVSVSSPTADQIMPNLPVSVGWAYSGDGDVQKKYRMKVFTAAVAEGVGFNVDTSANVFDSGEVSGSGASASITSGIDYGSQYYVYVKVAKDFNGADWWSDWSTGRRFRVNARPVATVTAPTGAVANTNKPTVTWSYTDAEGDVQTHYRVAIFEQPGGSWVGFNPDTATPHWDSGEIAGSVGSIQVATALLNLKTYRAYVKVKQSSPSIIESLWAYSDFTTNFAAAAVPNITTTAYEDRIDISVKRGPSALELNAAGEYASTPDHASLDIVGDLDLRVEVSSDDWTPGAVSQVDILSNLGNVIGYELAINPAGNILLIWGNGATYLSRASTVVPGFADGSTQIIRATLDADNGAAGHDVKFYKSTDNGATWTQIGATVTTAGVTSVAASDQPLVVGMRPNGLYPLTGKVYSAEVRNGIDGAIVANPRFKEQVPGTTSFTDSIGKVWTLGGTAAIVTAPEGTPAANWIDVERSLDGGVTWAPFRYGTLALSTDFSPAAPFTITDYEVPLGKPVQYRAYSVTTASGQEVASTPSGVASATPMGKKVWVKDPSNSALGRHFLTTDDWLSGVRRRARTLVQPLGRAKPIVVRGSGKGVSFSMGFLVFGEADHDALVALLEADRTLFVQTPKGNWYMEVSRDVNESAHLWDDLHNEEDVWKVTVPLVEVDF